jgi:hypothetical protein
MKYGNCQERDGDRGMRHEKNRNEERERKAHGARHKVQGIRNNEKMQAQGTRFKE